MAGDFVNLTSVAMRPETEAELLRTQTECTTLEKEVLPGMPHLHVRISDTALSVLPGDPPVLGGEYHRDRRLSHPHLVQRGPGLSLSSDRPKPEAPGHGWRAHNGTPFLPVLSPLYHPLRGSNRGGTRRLRRELFSLPLRD